MSEIETVLGFDFGRQRIGVAVGQCITATASALTTLQAIQQKPDWTGIADLIQEWRPDLLIIGHPTSMDGSAHELTRAAERFARQLRERFRLPVTLVDERLSSLEAEEQLRERRRQGGRRQGRGATDRIAAQIIVETWLNDPQIHEPD